MFLWLVGLRGDRLSCRDPHLLHQRIAPSINQSGQPSGSFFRDAILGEKVENQCDARRLQLPNHTNFLGALTPKSLLVAFVDNFKFGWAFSHMRWIIFFYSKHSISPHSS